MTTLRETVMAMPADDRLEYALSCWEMMTGEDKPLQRDIDGAVLTEQQARIFAMLNRSIGHAVPIERIISMLDATRPDAETTAVCVRTQITFIRKKLAGKYRVGVRYSDGYILERV